MNESFDFSYRLIHRNHSNDDIRTRYKCKEIFSFNISIPLATNHQFKIHRTKRFQQTNRTVWLNWFTNQWNQCRYLDPVHIATTFRAFLALELLLQTRQFSLLQLFGMTDMNYEHCIITSSKHICRHYRYENTECAANGALVLILHEVIVCIMIALHQTCEQEFK